MKKGLIVLGVLVCILIGSVAAQTPISTCTDLQNMNNSLAGNYYLTQDIDCSATITWNGGKGFGPIGYVTGESTYAAFTGTLDGRGHVIRNLHMKRSGTTIGMIGYNLGQIFDLGMINVSVESTTGGGSAHQVGGIVARNTGVINRTFVSGKVYGTTGGGSIVGGLAGHNDWQWPWLGNRGIIENSYSLVNVTGNTVGGVTGWQDAEVSGGKTNELRRVYAIGTVTPHSPGVSGGLVGRNGSDLFNDPLIVVNSFWDTQTSGQSTSQGGTGKTTAQMKTQGTFTGWDFANVWAINPAINNGYPYLRSVLSPIPLSTCEELRGISGQISLYGHTFFLTQDIDCSASSSWAGTPSAFYPIGDIDGHFMGEFDGKGHTISHLYIEDSFDTSGLFGSVEGGYIHDVGLVNVSVKNTRVTSRGYVGTLVGRNFGTLNRTFATGKAEGNIAFVGGLVGMQYNDERKPSSNFGIIENSYARVNVSSNNLTGGLVGAQDTVVTHRVRNSYATGLVNGNPAGGLVGGVGSPTVYDSFWDTQTSGQSTSQGGTGKTTAQMKTQGTFTGWDFANVWAINPAINNGYPYLLSVPPGGTGGQGGSGGAVHVCSSSEDIILALSNNTNAHGGTWNSGEGYEICYSEIFGASYGGGSPHSCVSGNTVVRLNATSNAHAETPELNTYGVDVCYGDLSCYSIDTGLSETCAAGDEIVVRLSTTTNAHLANASEVSYPIAICCGVSEPEPPGPGPGDAYWTNMQRMNISVSEIGDSVLMILAGGAGTGYTFEIFEKDFLFDDPIANVTETYDVGADLVAVWTITQSYWNVAHALEMGDPEFVFVVNSIESGQLVVPENSGNNSKPHTRIARPLFNATYIINTSTGLTKSVPFEHISSDVDDDLEITWFFGDGEEATFEHVLSTHTGNTTHQYNRFGTKLVTVRAEEMTRENIVENSTQLFVYREGLQIFAILSQPGHRIVQGAGLYTLDAGSSHVANCSSVGCPSGGSGGCYTVSDALDPSRTLDCRVVANAQDPNFSFIWTIDGIVDTSQTGSVFSRLFAGAEEHIINLKVSWSY